MSGGQLPTDDNLKPFYALGVNIARQVGGDIKPLLSAREIAVFLNGFQDSIENKIDDELTILESHGNKLNEVLTGRIQEVKNGEQQKTDLFLEQYLLKNPGAIRTKTGLIYNEVVAGTGAGPTVKSSVEVHYHGSLMNGKVFDSSVERGEPASFPLANVIQGWQEGIPLMKEGGKATIIIPPQLAYGDRGSPPVIPPGATLQFEVELIRVL